MDRQIWVTGWSTKRPTKSGFHQTWFFWLSFVTLPSRSLPPRPNYSNLDASEVRHSPEYIWNKHTSRSVSCNPIIPMWSLVPRPSTSPWQWCSLPIQGLPCPTSRVFWVAPADGSAPLGWTKSHPEIEKTCLRISLQCIPNAKRERERDD